MVFGKNLNSLLKTLCTELKRKQLHFCLAGCWAVSMMGIARTTIDIDLRMILDDTAKQEVISVLDNSFTLIRSHDDEMEFEHIRI
jgi:hypothetical protein